MVFFGSRYFFKDLSDEELDDEILARLSNMRSVVITSHQAYLTKEALEQIAAITFDNAREYFIEKKKLKALKNYIAPPDPSPILAQAKLRKMSSVGAKR